jgi:hypothetical protein
MTTPETTCARKEQIENIINGCTRQAAAKAKWRASSGRDCHLAKMRSMSHVRERRLGIGEWKHLVHELALAAARRVAGKRAAMKAPPASRRIA